MLIDTGGFYTGGRPADVMGDKMGLEEAAHRYFPGHRYHDFVSLVVEHMPLLGMAKDLSHNPVLSVSLEQRISIHSNRANRSREPYAEGGVYLRCISDMGSLQSQETLQESILQDPDRHV
eukprot:CAMPEP_0118694822 /NCGR_PEP_ID=MMETSP0800-20121206/12783_1 /TAXON_ID=210618 ORGANISM="Striatella unipunctata, Strain CCMP2910" /NCGR_SAMPLE_ID=MMETSP0800 /ASSEMBLY_ACC=CAM_ASM_000638 /LENGTH=119 /DNA_ID=CAMNT_0006593423 /DNA_START=356 /DNA_END=716 /DNA_ORIENTATION=-